MELFIFFFSAFRARVDHPPLRASRQIRTMLSTLILISSKHLRDDLNGKKARGVGRVRAH